MTADVLLGTPGLIVPPMTPYTSDGDVNYDAFEAQIDYIIETCEATAMPILGVEAQEYRYLSADEREQVIRHCVALVDDRIPSIVGISDPSYHRAIEYAEIAADVDADAVLLLIPDRGAGGVNTDAELFTYFEEIATHTELPIVAYHNPSAGSAVPPDFLSQLAELDSVIAFKES